MASAVQPLVDVYGVAEYLGMSTWSIYKLVERDELPYLRVGRRRLRFDLEDVRRFIEENGAEQ